MSKKEPISESDSNAELTSDYDGWMQFDTDSLEL